MLNHKWLSINEYAKETGLSRSAISKLIEEKELIATTTDGGGKVLIKVELSDDKLHHEILALKAQVSRLCKHLGVGA